MILFIIGSESSFVISELLWPLAQGVFQLPRVVLDSEPRPLFLLSLWCSPTVVSIEPQCFGGVAAVEGGFHRCFNRRSVQLVVTTSMVMLFVARTKLVT